VSLVELQLLNKIAYGNRASAERKDTILIKIKMPAETFLPAGISK
jgi:hypothetical protein